MANKPKNAKAPKKFWLSLQLPLEDKATFEKIAESENRSVKAQAIHILKSEIDRFKQESATQSN